MTSKFFVAMTAIMLQLFLLVAALLIRSINILLVITNQTLMEKQAVAMQQRHQQRKLHTSLNSLIVYLTMRKAGKGVEKHSTVLQEDFR
jgi:hypothetical protein